MSGNFTVLNDTNPRKDKDYPGYVPIVNSVAATFGVSVKQAQDWIKTAAHAIKVVEARK